MAANMAGGVLTMLPSAASFGAKRSIRVFSYNVDDLYIGHVSNTGHLVIEKGSIMRLAPVHDEFLVDSLADPLYCTTFVLAFTPIGFNGLPQSWAIIKSLTVTFPVSMSTPRLGLFGL